MLEGNLRWTSIPSRGSSNTPSRLHATQTGIISGSCCPECGFTFTLLYSVPGVVGREKISVDLSLGLPEKLSVKTKVPYEKQSSCYFFFLLSRNNSQTSAMTLVTQS